MIKKLGAMPISLIGPVCRDSKNIKFQGPKIRCGAWAYKGIVPISQINRIDNNMLLIVIIDPACTILLL